MKKSIVRGVALILSLVMVAVCFAGCGSKGKTLMVLDQDGTKVKLSVNLFQLYLSRLKGQMAVAGEDVLNSNYWDAWISQDGTTRNDQYTNYILEEAKTYLAALYLFEKNDLKLPNETLDAIDAELAELMDYRADGSKSQFNALLAEYGVNYKLLREAMIISEKISYLKQYLFGADGSKIAENLVDDYYRENYRRFKVITLYASEYVYYTDGDGEDIYYTDKTYKKIAYDTSAEKKVDANGALVVDSNGDQVYVKTDASEKTLVAYDTEKGIRRNQTDANGEEVIRVYEKDSAEYKQLIDKVEQIKAKIEEKDFDGFDALVKEYNQSEDMTKYTSGYYVTRTSNFDSPEAVEKVFNMDVGKFDTSTSTYAIHIFMRYDVEDKGYNLSQNNPFFFNVNTGKNLMMENLKNQLLAQHIDPLKNAVVVDTAVLSEADIKRIGANTWC